MVFAWKEQEEDFVTTTPTEFLVHYRKQEYAKKHSECNFWPSDCAQQWWQQRISYVGPTGYHEKSKYFLILYSHMFLNILFGFFTYSLLFQIFFSSSILLFSSIRFYISPVVPIKFSAYSSFCVVMPSSFRPTAQHSYPSLVQAPCQQRISLSVCSIFHFASRYPSVQQINSRSVRSARSV